MFNGSPILFPLLKTCNISNNLNLETNGLYEERRCYEEKYIVVARIHNFEGLDVTTLVMDSKFLKQVAGQIN
jgi:hypothetical protein